LQGAVAVGAEAELRTVPVEDGGQVDARAEAGPEAGPGGFLRVRGGEDLLEHASFAGLAPDQVEVARFGKKGTCRCPSVLERACVRIRRQYGNMRDKKLPLMAEDWCGGDSLSGRRWRGLA
jgi:hypothetical protein